jgi:hypothetical protein
MICFKIVAKVQKRVEYTIFLKLQGLVSKFLKNGINNMKWND